MALVERFQGHQGQGVFRVPASAFAFDAVGGRAALGFGGAAANLPAFGTKRGVMNQVAAFGHVVQQAVQGGFLRLAFERGPLRGELIPGRFVTLVFEGVHQRLQPSFSGFVIAIKSPSGFLGVVLEMPEIQAAGRQTQTLFFGLAIDPHRPVVKPDRSVGLIQPDPRGIASHQTAHDFMVAAADADPALLLIFRIKMHQPKFFVRPVGSGRHAFQRFERTPLGFEPLSVSPPPWPAAVSFLDR